MKKLILALMALIGMTAAAQDNFSQQLGYDVHYHWGPVDVRIAHGVVDMQADGSTYTATMNGNSIPWDGRIFCISDTLVAQMTPGPSGLPQEQVTYQAGWYLKPRVREYRSNSFNALLPQNYKNIAGQGTLDASANTMEAVTVTADMLGMFYYVRELDFASMSPGQATTINIGGGYARSVTVTYRGQGVTDACGITYPTYNIEFEYTYNGAPSGYPVAMAVAQSGRIPVKISASLPAGHVEMLYDGQ